MSEKRAIVKGGVVSNIVIGGKQGIPCSDEVQIGWAYENEAFVWPTYPVTVRDIRLEARRRIIQLCGAESFDDCLAKQANAQARATELLEIMALGGTLTTVQEAERVVLKALRDGIKQIRSKSNELETTLPEDYENDLHWSA